MSQLCIVWKMTPSGAYKSSDGRFLIVPHAIRGSSADYYMLYDSKAANPDRPVTGKLSELRKLAMDS